MIKRSFGKENESRECKWRGTEPEKNNMILFITPVGITMKKPETRFLAVTAICYSGSSCIGK